MLKSGMLEKQSVAQEVSLTDAKIDRRMFTQLFTVRTLLLAQAGAGVGLAGWRLTDDYHRAAEARRHFTALQEESDGERLYIYAPFHVLKMKEELTKQGLERGALTGLPDRLVAPVLAEKAQMILINMESKKAEPLSGYHTIGALKAIAAMANLAEIPLHKIVNLQQLHREVHQICRSELEKINERLSQHIDVLQIYLWADLDELCEMTGADKRSCGVSETDKVRTFSPLIMDKLEVVRNSNDDESKVRAFIDALRVLDFCGLRLQDFMPVNELKTIGPEIAKAANRLAAEHATLLSNHPKSGDYHRSWIQDHLSLSYRADSLHTAMGGDPGLLKGSKEQLLVIAQRAGLSSTDRAAAIQRASMWYSRPSFYDQIPQRTWINW